METLSGIYFDPALWWGAGRGWGGGGGCMLIPGCALKALLPDLLLGLHACDMMWPSTGEWIPYISIGLGNSLAPNRRQAITWTSDDWWWRNGHHWATMFKLLLGCFFKWSIKVYVNFLLFLGTESSLSKAGPSILRIHYHGCTCPGPLRLQGISSHDIDKLSRINPVSVP